MPPVGRDGDDAVLDDALGVRLGDLLGVGEDEGHRLLRLVRAVAVLVLRALALLVLEELVRVAELLEQLDLGRVERLAQQHLREEKLLLRKLAQQVVRLVAVDALLLRVEASDGGRLALGRLVEHQLDSSARLDDADLQEARAQVDADDGALCACQQQRHARGEHAGRQEGGGLLCELAQNTW